MPAAEIERLVLNMGIKIVTIAVIANRVLLHLQSCRGLEAARRGVVVLLLPLPDSITPRMISLVLPRS